MIKKIKTPSVRVGMYINAFGEGSNAVNFEKPPFLLKKNATRLRLQASNIQFILIDTDKGLDVETKTIEKPVPAHPTPRNQLRTLEELPAAKIIVERAHGVMKHIMTEIHMGKPLDMKALEPIAEKMMDSVIRSDSALVSLTRIKNKDDYTFMHSVSVAGLLIVLAKANALDEKSTYEVTLGGLLHDIGKMRTPNEILNKPGALTQDELVVMHNHVIEARPLLEERFNLSQNTLDVVFQHHEKIDGSGYPYGLKDPQLSQVGKMSAIVDVYDALTSTRVYKPAWEPAFALKKMLNWTDKHLDRDQLLKLTYCLGVYPVGSFVEMESGRIGVVIDQHESDITKPLVKFFYNAQKEYTKVEIVDLSQEKNDHIHTPINPEEFGINSRDWIHKA